MTLDRSVANTRSCVGVKSLMSVPGSVKLHSSILCVIFLLVLSICYEIIGRRTHEIFSRIAPGVSLWSTPTSCTQTRHRFCTACPQASRVEAAGIVPQRHGPRPDLRLGWPPGSRRRMHEHGSAPAGGQGLSRAPAARGPESLAGASRPRLRAAPPRGRHRRPRLLKPRPPSHTSGAIAQGLRFVSNIPTGEQS